MELQIIIRELDKSWRLTCGSYSQMWFRNQHEQQITFKHSNEEDQEYKEQCSQNHSYIKVSLSPTESTAYGGSVLTCSSECQIEVFFSEEFNGVIYCQGLKSNQLYHILSLCLSFFSLESWDWLKLCTGIKHRKDYSVHPNVTLYNSKHNQSKL